MPSRAKATISDYQIHDCGDGLIPRRKDRPEEYGHGRYQPDMIAGPRIQSNSVTLTTRFPVPRVSHRLEARRRPRGAEMTTLTVEPR